MAQHTQSPDSFLNTRFITSISVRKFLGWALILGLVFITIFPFYWMFRTSLTNPKAIFQDTKSLMPVDATLENFQRVLGLVDIKTAQAAGGAGQSLNFLLFLRNTVIVALLTTVGQVSFSAMAAYAFARLRFPFRNQLFFVYLMGLMIPGVVLLIPNFVFIKNMGWIDTFQGIVAPAFLMSPFAVFFLRQFFLSLNQELIEAAKLDGAGQFAIFWRVALPLSSAPLMTLAILTFIGSWNDYLWPLLVGKSENVRVLTVALGVFRSQSPGGTPDWAGLMAGSSLAIIPTLILFVFLGRRVVDSIQFSGFK
jgi:multiple sugar transport system permease protein